MPQSLPAQRLAGPTLPSASSAQATASLFPDTLGPLGTLLQTPAFSHQLRPDDAQIWVPGEGLTPEQHDPVTPAPQHPTWGSHGHLPLSMTTSSPHCPSSCSVLLSAQAGNLGHVSLCFTSALPSESIQDPTTLTPCLTPTLVTRLSSPAWTAQVPPPWSLSSHTCPPLSTPPQGPEEPVDTRVRALPPLP